MGSTKKILLILAFAIAMAATVSAGAVLNQAEADINFVVNYGYSSTGALDINFNVMDLNVSANATDSNLAIAIYYSTSAGGLDNLIYDGNLVDAVFSCNGTTDFTAMVNCKYSWLDVNNVTDGNYYIDINISDFNVSTEQVQDSNVGSSTSSFKFESTPTISAPANGGSVVYTNNLTLTIAAMEDPSIDTYYLTIDNNAAGGVEINNGTTLTYDFGTVTSSSHTIYVKASDTTDKNTLTATTTFTMTTGPGGQGPFCGDGTCYYDEDSTSCPEDCSEVCGDGACTRTESVGTCPADCTTATTVVCGDGICSPTENGNGPKSCPEDCEGTTPGQQKRETLRERTFTGKPTSQEMVDLLTRVGASQNAIDKASAAVGKTTVRREVTVEKLTSAEGVVSYQAKITVTVSNASGKKLKNVRVLEEIPKLAADTATKLRGNFAILLDDPVVEFDAGTLSAGGTASFIYYIDKEVSEVALNDYSAPVVSNAEEETIPVGSCSGVNCNDGNQCTNDSCSEGNCSYVQVADGTSCGFGNECKAGICVAFTAPPGGTGDAAAGDMTLLIVVAVAVIIGIAAYYIYAHQK
ncbi:MAG: hypothetical protein ABID38_05735 [Candidatus Diapherotrites archaeon]